MLWGGRFKQKIDDVALKFSSSLSFDKKLFYEDLKCTEAHVKMLKKINILTNLELNEILSGLTQLKHLWDTNEWVPSEEEHEDIHSAVETKLTELIGETAGKIHTGRSRNDQVVTDTKLWLIVHVNNLIQLIEGFQKTLLEKSKEYKTELIPSYTHLQQAQPISFGFHLMTYMEMLERDKNHFKCLLDDLDESPLGAGAVAGSTIELDRNFASMEMGFKRPTRHAMDTVSNRDYLLDFLHYISVSMMHLSRLSEELILWTSAEFNWVKLSDAYTTGSSLMPQKRNSDMAELIRGKVGRVYGNYIALMTTMKALPLAYNRDMQEDKEPMFDSYETYNQSLIIMNQMIKTMKFVDSNKIKSAHILATDLADEFVKKGVPFRKSHELVGEIIKISEETGKTYLEIQKEGLANHILLFSEIDIPTIQNALEKKKTYGNCSPTEVDSHINYFEKRLNK